MNKKDMPLIIVLFLLLCFWPQIYKMIVPAPTKTVERVQVQQTRTATANVTAVQDTAPSNDAPAMTATAVTDLPETKSLPAPLPTTDATDGDEAKQQSEGKPIWQASKETGVHEAGSPETSVLSNNLLDISVSSWGGGIVTAMLKDFHQTNSPDSGLLVLDFSGLPALTYVGVPELSTNFDFVVTPMDGRLLISRTTSSGLRFERTLTLAPDSYDLKVTDRFTNTGSDTTDVHASGIHLGPMADIKGETKDKGFSYIGIDSQATGGEKTRHWANKSFFSKEMSLPGLFNVPGQKGGFMCWRPPAPAMMDFEKHSFVRSETYWLAAKNKFFVQCLSPLDDLTGIGFTLHAMRMVSPSEKSTPEDPKSWTRDAVIREAAATLHFASRALLPGESFERKFSYYVGPKKYSILKTLGKGDVMEFGFWSFVCIRLLPILNWIHSIVPSYGLAIMLLTLLIRLVFWPIMRKGTASMKKMQEIQPQLKELKLKFGDDHQKFLKKQQELFKENGVNPLGSCLPVLIQIPVFISLFTVLRSAVELRFAPFLWIKDLSAPEGLFAGQIPFPPYELNILPLLMTATMIWQQKLTPSAGDPQQQKMMAIFMPIMMLFFFYSMASALVLYWTTSQCLAIAGLLIKDWKDRKKGITPVKA